jgi:hypothetical protein
MRKLLFLSFGRTGPLRTENLALQLTILQLEAKVARLKTERQMADLLSGMNSKPLSQISYRSSGNSDAAMLSR